MIELLTAEEAAPKIRATPTWLTKAAQRGEVPSVKVGRRRFFRESDLVAWLDRQAQASDAWARSPRSQSRRRIA